MPIQKILAVSLPRVVVIVAVVSAAVNKTRLTNCLTDRRKDKQSSNSQQKVVPVLPNSLYHPRHMIVKSLKIIYLSSVYVVSAINT